MICKVEGFQGKYHVIYVSILLEEALQRGDFKVFQIKSFTFLNFVYFFM